MSILTRIVLARRGLGNALAETKAGIEENTNAEINLILRDVEQRIYIVLNELDKALLATNNVE